MKFENQKGPLSQIEADVLVIALFKGEDPEMVLRELDAKLSLDMLKNLKKFLSEEDFKASDFETRTFPTGNMHPTGRILIVGMPEKVDASALRKAAANLARKLKLDNEPKNTCFYLRTRKAVPTKGKKPSSKTRSKGELQAQQEYLSAFVEGLMLGGYDFDKYKTKDKKNKSKKKSEAEIEIAGLDISDKDFAASVKLGTTLSEATNFAKTLIAEPAGYMTPTRLAKEAENMAESSGLSIKVLDKPQIKKLGMGAFLGVAMGSDEPARLIVLKYTASKAKKTIALVGKGITFDSGGLSLKPAANMERMKYDMSGAAAVLGAMKAIGILKPHVSVLAVVPATENMPSGRALRPGDVLKSMNGKTIEVNNTDAEGRLVLADALTYAQSQKVDEIIDVATLTGAIVQALGRVAAGIMGSSPEMIERVIRAGEKTGERFWHMPLFDEYKQALKSDIADLKNAGSRGEAGSSCAGMFLKEFVDSVPWVHLDIAGVAWSDKVKDEITKGGTAFGVRTLCRYVLDRD